MNREQPVCRRINSWLKGRGISTAILTGQDRRALEAFVHLLELYTVSDALGRAVTKNALRFAVAAMQPKCFHLAKACIPMVLDWSDEDPLWTELDGFACDVVKTHGGALTILADT